MLENVEKIASHLGTALLHVKVSDDKNIVHHLSEAHAATINLLLQLMHSEKEKSA